MPDTQTDLLDYAETAIRKKGYNAVSFRDLADGLGIKSASVHYHFRKKEDLGLALVARYSARFFEVLAEKPGDPLWAICDTYRDALYGSDAFCLCGMLGAESRSLPDAMSQSVSAFFQDNIDWLAAQLEGDKDHATQIIATLQGAMMLANSLNSPDVFDTTIERLKR